MFTSTISKQFFKILYQIFTLCFISLSTAYGSCGELFVQMKNDTSYKLTSRGNPHFAITLYKTSILFKQPWLYHGNPAIEVSMELNKLHNGQERKINITQLQQAFCLWSADPAPSITLEAVPHDSKWNGGGIYIYELRAPNYTREAETQGLLRIGIAD